MLVGYLGPKGSFTHGVASHAFLNDELIPYESLTELLKAFEQEAVGAAVVPVENSIEAVYTKPSIISSTTETFRLLRRSSIPSNNSYSWLKKTVPFTRFIPILRPWHRGSLLLTDIIQKPSLK